MAINLEGQLTKVMEGVAQTWLKVIGSFGNEFAEFPTAPTYPNP